LIFSDPRVFEHFGKGVKTYEETKESTERLAAKWDERGYGDLAICHEGKLIGEMILFPNKDNLFELGYVIRPDYWGTGFAKEASVGALSYAFNYTKTDKVIACARASNVRSIKILTHLGFSETYRKIVEDAILRIWYEITKYTFLSRDYKEFR
jgi:[ribosomal protein S5]-alanine N-acetyltransferase